MATSGVNLDSLQKEKVKVLLKKIKGVLFFSKLENPDEETLLSTQKEKQSEEAKNAFIQLQELLI